MDASMMTGTPWLDQPVMLHSSRIDKCKLTPAQCEYRRGHWRYWYQADHAYALPTVYFALAMIGLFILPRVINRILPATYRSSRLYTRTTAFLRYATYRGYRIHAFGWSSPSLGVMLLGSAAAVFFLAMTLGPQPYYWPNTKKTSYGSSPPIATRAGFMAVAILPFTLALSSKLNLITQLTGVPHEKLQTFHRWSAWAMFILGSIHTFPFIVYHISKGDMTMQWNTSLDYWTGIATIIPQAYLTFFSIGPLRNRYYEIFKSTHILAAVVFVIFFFIHCDFRLSSWDYFIAAGVVYFVPIMFSQLRTYLEYGISKRATLNLLPDGSVRVSVPVSPFATTPWQPGQHIFLRFLAFGTHAITAHPFTICSLPESGEMIFFVRPRGGITARLAAFAAKKPNSSVRVLLDGPYGGMQNRRLSMFDKNILIAGGSGAGFLLPLIEDVFRRQENSENDTSEKSSQVKSLLGRKMHVVVATRDEATHKWFKQEVNNIVSKYDNTPTLQVELHVTGYARQMVNGAISQGHSEEELQIVRLDKDVILEKDELIIANPSGAVTFKDRPDLTSIIQQATIGDAGGRSVGIAVCGPPSMLYDVRNAAAAAQARVWNGEIGMQDVYLHMEHFGW